MGRIVVLVGAVLAVIGLALTALVIDGLDALPALNQAVPEVPAGIPTIWGGLDTWAKVVIVVLLVLIVALAVRPPVRKPENPISAGVTVLVGVVFFAYAVAKLLEAGDDSLALMQLFDRLGEVEPRLEALDAISGVDPGPGFFIILLGTALVAIGGLFGLLASLGAADEGRVPVWQRPIFNVAVIVVVFIGVVATWSAIATSLANQR